MNEEKISLQNYLETQLGIKGRKRTIEEDFEIRGCLEHPIIVSDGENRKYAFVKNDDIKLLNLTLTHKGCLMVGVFG